MIQRAMIVRDYRTKISFLRSRLQSESGRDAKETEDEIKELGWRIQEGV